MKPIAAGYVFEVRGKSFWVRMTTEVRKKNSPCDLEAKISVRKLLPRERPFVREGAYFAILKGGTIRFSRLKWKKREIAAIRERAAKRYQKIGWK